MLQREIRQYICNNTCTGSSFYTSSEETVPVYSYTENIIFVLLSQESHATLRCVGAVVTRTIVKSSATVPSIASTDSLAAGSSPIVLLLFHQLPQ